MEAIKTINLRKEYKDIVAVDNLNLSIEEGELFSLLGVNGAGKTTTIKMLSTLTKPTSGDAYIYDYSITKDQDKIKELVDISMQETAIARKLTVEENIEFYATLSGQNKLRPMFFCTGALGSRSGFLAAASCARSAAVRRGGSCKRKI